MVTVRVLLACATPTNRPGGAFDTFVSLPLDAFLLGEHIRRAERRAGIVGFRGPYTVTEVRRLDTPVMSIEDVRARLAELAVNVRLERWLSIVDEAAADRPPTPTPPPPRSTRRRESAKL